MGYYHSEADDSFLLSSDGAASPRSRFCFLPLSYTLLLSDTIKIDGMDCDNDVMCEQGGWVQRRKGFFTSTWILFTCRWLNETRHFNQQPEERRRVQNLMATTSSVGSEAEGSSRVYVWGENKFLLILNPSIGRRLQCRNYVDICSGSSSRPGRARLVGWLVGLSAFPIPSLGLFLTVVGLVYVGGGRESNRRRDDLQPSEVCL